MRRFIQTQKPQIYPQAASVVYDSNQYWPVFLHATINQTHPVGHKKTFIEHAHDFFHIVMYTSGHGEYSTDAKFYSAQPGTCVLIHPGQRHDFVSRWKQSVYSEITFSYQDRSGSPLRITFEKLLSIFTGFEIALPARVDLPIDQMHVLKNLLTVLTDHLNSAHLVSEYHANHDLVMIFNFLAGIAAAKNELSFSEARFERTKHYIDEHYFEQITIDQLAGMIGVSKGYFFREFKKRFAVSPLAYQQMIRIEAAKTLLKTTSLQCGDIADRIGFNDPFFFNRVFKKHTGLTPLQYRKSNAKQ